jgi:transposase InsO family protein
VRERFGVSERRACQVLGQARWTQRHQPRLREDEPRLVARIIELALEDGTPDFIRSDYGSEFTAQAVRDWLERVGVDTLFITPGSPW